MKNIGKFEIASGGAMISDPCYERGTWCQGILDHVKNGEWIAEVVERGDRIFELHANHISNPNATQNQKSLKRAEFEVGVDSGKAGIFDSKHYRDDNPLSNATGIVPYGCVSSSGYGDGSYVCYYHKNEDGEIDGIMIGFDDVSDLVRGEEKVRW